MKNHDYEVGEKVRITDNYTCHSMALGHEDVIKIVRDYKNDGKSVYILEGSEGCYCNHDELELIDGPTERENEAEDLRKNRIPKAIMRRDEAIVKANDDIAKMEARAEALELYDTEEDAEAATIAGVLNSGGDTATIKTLLAKFKARVR